MSLLKQVAAKNRVDRWKNDGENVRCKKNEATDKHKLLVQAKVAIVVPPTMVRMISDMRSRMAVRIMM